MIQQTGHLTLLRWEAIQMGGETDTPPAGIRAHTHASEDAKEGQ